METKALAAVLFFILISSVINSQNNTTLTTYSKSSQDYIYADDLDIEGVHYLMICKLTETNGKTVYKFEVKKGDSTKYFIMNDIKVGEKSLNSIKSELNLKLTELGYVETEESKKKVDNIASEFLANAYMSIIVKSDSGDEVGVLSLNPKVKVYKNWKKPEVAFEINTNKVDIKIESEQIAESLRLSTYCVDDLSGLIFRAKSPC